MNDGVLGATQIEVEISAQDQEIVFAQTQETIEPTDDIHQNLEENASLSESAATGESAHIKLFDEEEEDIKSSAEPDNKAQTEEEEVSGEPVDSFEDVVRIPIEREKGVPNFDDNLMLVGLPTSVFIDPDLFDRKLCETTEKSFREQNNRAAITELTKTMTGHAIRTRLHGDKKQSTAKYVEFSDGSSAIIVGKAAYTQNGSTSQNLSSALIEVSQLPIMRIHGVINERRMYTLAQPSQLQASLFGSKTPRAVRSAATTEGQKKSDHELKHQDQQKYSSLNAEFLEAD